MLTNKVILLTGANGGIGSALAHALTAAGATLILNGLEESRLTTLAEELGGEHEILVGNIATTDGRKTIATYCQQHETGVHMLINNAGIGCFESFINMDEEKVIALINVNLTSTMLLTQALLPILKTQQEAQIINIGSTFGSIGFPGFTVYSASKFGIRGFTEALNRELKDSSVSVRYFAPRATETTLNDTHVNALNTALKTTVDTPEQVANEFLAFIKSNDPRCFVGWPEKLFARINGSFPSVVDNAIGKQLPIIQRCLPNA